MMTNSYAYFFRFITMFIILGVSLPLVPGIAQSETTRITTPEPVSIPASQSSDHTEKKWPGFRLRGINTKLVMPLKNNPVNPGALVSKEIFDTLAGWGVNLIRVDIRVDEGSIWDVKKGEISPPVPTEDPLCPYKKHLNGLETALELASKYNIYVIVSAGNVVGRRIDPLYIEDDGKSYHGELPKLWKYVAEKFGAHKYLLGYDLLNEPVEKKGENNWRNKILPELIQTIRAIDTKTYLIIEPAPWGSSESFADFEPVKDNRAVYSFHFYTPHTYTYQGLKNRPRGLVYPGLLKQYRNSPTLPWNREQMVNYLQDAIRFQKKYGVRILVGEFSAVRWAPNAAKWIEDAVSVFEEYGWDWCFHGYGGWNGWNPTFSADAPENSQTDGGQETDRLLVLKKAWRQGRSPEHEKGGLMISDAPKQ